MVRALGKLVCQDVRSLTGRNFHTIGEATQMNIRPGVSHQSELSTWIVYEQPEGEEWRLQFLLSLLAIRDQGWEVIFDDETELVNNNLIQIFIDNICIRG